METQNLQADGSGHYSVTLGSTSSQGLPQEIFTSGEARWLGVQPQGQAEQPRVLLMSVPYAMKALDAETIGGRPASSFMLAPAVSGSSAKDDALPPANITGSGTANFVPVFTGTTTIGNSKMYETAGGNVGINTTTPAATLDVKGKGDVRDTLTLFPKGTHPTLSVHGTALSVSNTGVVTFVAGQSFPGTGTVTSVGSGAGLTGGPITTSGTLSIASAGVTNAMLQNSSLTVTANSPLTGGGAVSLGGSTSLGLKSCSNNQVLQFVSGAWTCAGIGTITGVTAGTDLTGGGTSGNVTLNLDTTKVPQLSANNVFTGTNAFYGNNLFVGDQTMRNETDDFAAVGGHDDSPGGGVGLYGVSANGIPVFGSTTATSGFVRAVQGQTASTGGVGVLGNAVATSGSPIGVYGQSFSSGGVGVFGQNGYAESHTGLSLAGYGVGTWGDGGTTGNFGVLGTTDDAAAGIFENNSAGFDSLYARNTNTLGFPFFAQNLTNNTYCNVDAVGNLNCTGTKNAVVPIDGGKRIVAMSAIESPKNWFEDFGSAELSSGSAVVALDPDFIQTVNTEREYMVIPVPNGECKGLYVTNKTATSFEVRELGSGTSSIRFDYRIVALRRKYEDVRFADHTNDPDPRKMMERMKSARPQANPEAKPAKAPVNTSILARPSTAAPGTTESSKALFKTPNH